MANEYFIPLLREVTEIGSSDYTDDTVDSVYTIKARARDYWCDNKLTARQLSVVNKLADYVIDDCLAKRPFTLTGGNQNER